MTIKSYDPIQETWGNSHPDMRPNLSVQQIYTNVQKDLQSDSHYATFPDPEVGGDAPVVSNFQQMEENFEADASRETKNNGCANCIFFMVFFIVMWRILGDDDE